MGFPEADYVVDELKPVLNTDSRIPINHIIWLNDYKFYGEESYVYQDKNKLHELYKDGALCIHDKSILEEASNWCIDNGYAGAFLAEAYDMDATAVAVLKPLTTMNAIAASSTAMNAILASSTAMNAITKVDTALKAVCSNASAANAISSAIQNYRSNIVNTLNASSLFNKTSTTVGNGAGTWTSGLDANNVYIPTSCYDDGDTDYDVYWQNSNTKVVTIARHSSTSTVTAGVSLRGIKVVGTGSTKGYVGFDVYTVK